MTNSFFGGMPRIENPVRGFAIVALVSLSVAALAAYVSDSRPPALGDVTIGTLPVAALVVSVVALLLVKLGRERFRAALDAGIEAALLGLLFGGIGSATNLFTDGTSSTALILSDAIKFIATGGASPASIGPSAVVRFFPLAAALAVFFHFRRKGSIVRTVAATVIAYLVPCLALLSTTWAGQIISMGTHASVSDPASLFKTLVTAHADGYWTSIQADRFLLPASRQAENALLGFRAAVSLLLAAAAFTIGVGGSRATAALLKRVSSASSVRLLLIAVAGLAFGLATAPQSSSHATVVATVFGVVVLASWLAARRFASDLAELPRHEREHPEYPLPSGVIQPHDLEAITASLLAFSLLGAAVLGYPVFLALLAATMASRLPSEMTETAQPWFLALVSFALALSLAEAGGLLTIRALAVPGWVSRTFLGLATVVAFEILFRRYAMEIESRPIGVIAAVLGFIVAAIVANQTVFWAIVLLAGLFLAISARSPGKWHRYGPRVFDGAIAIVALLSLFVPQVFRRF